LISSAILVTTSRISGASPLSTYLTRLLDAVVCVRTTSMINGLPFTSIRK
jgi:hypothetical protein